MSKAPEILEREACLAVMARVYSRLSGMEIHEEPGVLATIHADAVRLELRRLDEAMEGIRQGLHRDDAEGDAA